jgi:hypothetical protein
MRFVVAWLAANLTAPRIGSAGRPNNSDSKVVKMVAAFAVESIIDALHRHQLIFYRPLG